MTVTDVGLLKAFWGGFSSFYTIWQLCLMQISPFFMAFTTGLYIAEGKKTGASPLIAVLLAGFGYILGFSTLFALTGAQGLGVSKYILYYLGDLRKIAGVYVGLIAIFIPMLNLFKKGIPPKLVYFFAGMLLGISFSISYSPCIPPVMSDIMNFASKPANRWRGFILMEVYGMGLTISFLLTGTALALLAGRFAQKRSAKNAVIAASSAVLLIMTVLLLTDMMTIYKSYLVGMVLD